MALTVPPRVCGPYSLGEVWATASVTRFSNSRRDAQPAKPQAAFDEWEQTLPHNPVESDQCQIALNGPLCSGEPPTSQPLMHAPFHTTMILLTPVAPRCCVHGRPRREQPGRSVERAQDAHSTVVHGCAITYAAEVMPQWLPDTCYPLRNGHPGIGPVGRQRSMERLWHGLALAAWSPGHTDTPCIPSKGAQPPVAGA